MKKKPYTPSRRQILKHGAGLGAASYFAGTLSHKVFAQSTDDYKALVYIFLAGGNDAFNTLVPMGSGDLRTRYEDGRRNIALAQNNLHYLNVPSPIDVYGGDIHSEFGLHPNCGDIANLFNQNELGIICNLGNLLEPTTRDSYRSGESLLPPQLFSHADQQRQFQSEPNSPFRYGWGGRCAEILSSFNPDSNVSPLISVSGLNSFQVTRDGQINPYVMKNTGVTNLNGFNNSTETMVEAYMQSENAGHSLMSQKYAEVYRSARKASDIINSAFDAADANGIDYQDIFNAANAADSDVGKQLMTVAKLIAGRAAHTNTRPVFFVKMGGFDTHQNVLADHAELMTTLNNALLAFRNALTEQNDFDKTLSFVGTEFGRTFTPNGSDSGAGTDHAWGGHAFAMGGMIDGGRLYGSHPDLQLGQGLDVDNSRGRWIPTSSTAQVCAPVAHWLGVPQDELAGLFPSLSNFSSPFEAEANLGFIAGV